MKPPDCFGQMPLFNRLTHSQLGEICQDILERRFEPGEIIFHEGDPGEVVYLLKAGQVRIFVSGLDGSETSVMLIGQPGQVFGELAVIDGLPRSATAVSLNAVSLYTLSREAFTRHAQRIPQFSLNFLQELSHRLRYNTQQVDSLASLGVPQRLARKLLELAQAYGQIRPDGIFINLTLTQTDLASLIGATRESTNKSLRDFRRHQWIQLRQGHITILNQQALQAQISL